MLRKLLFTLVLATGFALSGFAQVGQGTIKGTVNDDTGESVPFANVTLLRDGNQVLGTTTDFDGKYVLKPIPPGTYTVQVSFVGYQTKKISGVSVSSDKITDLNMKISQGVDLEEVVIEYERPVFEKDQTTSGATKSRKEIEQLAVRSVADIVKTAGNGIVSRDNGSGANNVRGSRAGASVTFIDGVKVIGSTSLPKSAIEEVSVKTGGLSAQYGDVTGAVTTVTTRGAFKEYFGSLEVLSSGFRTGETTSFGLDKYGFNLFGFAVGGPILTKKDDKGKVIESNLGFLLTGEFRSVLDGRPAVTQLWKPTDENERLVRENPYILDEQTNTVLKRAEFLTTSDFEEIDFNLNRENKNGVINGKFDIKLSNTSNLAVGGTFTYSQGRNYSRAFSLYNYENNSQSTVTDYRVFARYTQRFENEEVEEGEQPTSLISNAFFSLQADFSRRSTETADRNHGTDFFRYGYVGRFDAITEFSYGNDDVVVLDGQEFRGRFLTAFDAPIRYQFTPSDINPILANYTRDYYAAFDPNDPRYTTRELVEGNGGIVNGGGVTGAVYNQWSAAGTVGNSYAKAETDQIRLTGSGSADVGDHAIKLGFEYEQRVQRFYNLNPRDLWDIGRLLVNSHILQIDSSQFSVAYENPNPTSPTITFERRYDGDNRSFFAYNMRRALGLDPDGTDFIDFDSHDIDLYNINFFSADQLINPVNNINLAYRGFNYTGKKLNAAPSLDDFFNETNELGFRTRPIPAYQPVYIAGYLEDKFSFDDLIFRLGVRLDRFDANQPVLRDQFSLFPTRNVAFARTQGLSEVPDNIGEDFIVYVSDLENPEASGVVGYRDPSTDVFFNAQGEVLNDPTVLQSGSTISPWLVDPSNTNTVNDLNTESFEDYDPQYIFMPRISFSFPISDEATFFANYDILTQRPSGENGLEPIDLIYIQSHNRIINNPNLRPTRTITYEIGFKQKLSKRSALTLQSYYRELRDDIQVRNLVGAFPQDYLTFDNLDFGTTKGFTVDYDLRRTKNISLKLNYTIAFAEGTGSGSTTAINLVNSNQPNLRTIFPFSFDQRHQIVATLDYRYGSGRNYKGPKMGDRDILANTGLNVQFFAASGTPYTSRSLPGSSELLSGSATQQPVEGDFNGSRLPWTLRMDARLDRTFTIHWGEKSEANENLWKRGKKQSTLNVYLQVLNVLNRENIQSVYAFTGNPNDDGFLASPLFQDQIRSQVSEQSFRDQYTLRLQNPFNFELPRRIRLGAQLSF